MTYQDKLHDQRWKDKRSEILERDKYKCANCSTRNNLQVHHRAYILGAEPWQYPDTFLITLCEYCHSSEEYYKNAIKELCDKLSLNGVPYQDIFRYILELEKT